MDGTNKDIRVGCTGMIAGLLMLVVMAAPVQADAPVVLEDGQLRFTSKAPSLLSGKHLLRLKDGASVTYAAQAVLVAENQETVLARNVSRFIVSYDLWEEKFSVTKIGRSREVASHLSSTEAESWCLRQMTIPAMGVDEGRRVRARVEFRVEESDRRLIDDDSVVNFSRLIELFGRRAGDASSRWVLDSGPFQLASLAGKGGGGGKGGQP